MSVDPEKWCSKETLLDKLLKFLKPFVIEKKVKITYLQAVISTVFSFLYFYKAEGWYPFLHILWFGLTLIFLLLMLNIITMILELLSDIKEITVSCVKKLSKNLKKNS